MRRAVGALVLGLALCLGCVLAIGGCAAAGAGPTLRPIVVVSLTSPSDPWAARRDQATVERAIRFLMLRGASIAPVRFEVLDRPALAVVLLELDEAGDPCGSARWRTALAPLDLDPEALVLLVGGTIRSPVPFARRAGVTCPRDGTSCAPPSRSTGAVILSDRRPVDGVDPAVVLLHEIGHAAGLGHAGEADPCGRAVGATETREGGLVNVMLADLHAAAGGSPTAAVTLDDVTLTPLQTNQIAGYSASGDPTTVTA